MLRWTTAYDHMLCTAHHKFSETIFESFDLGVCRVDFGLELG